MSVDASIMRCRSGLRLGSLGSLGRGHSTSSGLVVRISTVIIHRYYLLPRKLDQLHMKCRQKPPVKPRPPNSCVSSIFISLEFSPSHQSMRLGIPTLDTKECLYMAKKQVIKSSGSLPKRLCCPRYTRIACGGRRGFLALACRYNEPKESFKVMPTSNG